MAGMSKPWKPAPWSFNQDARAAQYAGEEPPNHVGAHRWALDPTGESATTTPVATTLPGGPTAQAPGGYSRQAVAPRTATTAARTGRSDAALGALETQITAASGTGSYKPPQIPIAQSTYGDDRAADRASYGQAKERTGLALRSALRGLRETMASRGIGGSGIEAAETRNLFAGGLGELADTDRQMAERSAGRAFTSNEANVDRLIDQNQFNANQIREAEQTRLGRRDRGLEMLLQIARSYG